jgi:hypothetical protein
MKIRLIAIIAAFGLPWLCLAQHKDFIQAELVKTIKAKTAKAGDLVKARAVAAVLLPGGITIMDGTMLYGEVHAADANSLSISFEQVEQKGKKTPLSLSIRAAMVPDAMQNNVDGIAGQAGSVIGMPGVTLQVDESPQHASKFVSNGKELQLRQGLQLMLAAPE